MEKQSKGASTQTSDEYLSRLEQIQSTYKNRKVSVSVPPSDFPELIIKVPDSWPRIILAPLYDVHIGNPQHYGKLFDRDLEWIAAEPYVLTWDGGDLIENVTRNSPGEQTKAPEEQYQESIERLACIQHKLLFKICGNHEARTYTAAGFSLARRQANDLQIPYFPDYCFARIQWRGNNFRLLAHHGSGASATPGGQRNAARKDMPWHSADLYWFGHLHQPLIDPVYRTDYDQRDSRIVTRGAMAITSPSFVRYFGGYAAAKRLAPGITGLTKAVLYPNGDMSAEVRVKGKRL